MDAPLLAGGTPSLQRYSHLPDAPPQRVERNYPIVRAFRQAVALLVSLCVVTYFAVSIYCGSFGAWFTKIPFSNLNHTDYFGSCKAITVASGGDILVANLVLALFWFFGEQLIQKFGYQIADEVATGELWQRLRDNQDEASGIVPPSKRINHAAHSAAWNASLARWKANKAERQKKFNSGTVGRAYVFYAVFLVVALVVLLIVLAISPKHHSSHSISNMASGFFDFQVTGAFDVCMIFLMIFETGLFLLATCFVRWPEKHPELQRPRVQVGVEQVAAVRTAQTMFATDDELALNVSRTACDFTRGLIPDVALMIACHKSTVTPERTETFKQTLRAAMRLFPANAIFVCDNGGFDKPADRTVDVCREVAAEPEFYPDGSQQVNYLFIPEGNKSHAMYWCTEFWVPHLVAAGVLEEPQYALLIDDDVPLPPDLQVPLQKLAQHGDIKAISYAIEAATESGNYSTLVALQDAEYKLVGTMKQLQEKMGTAMYCHGAIGLWRRDILGKKVLWDHDTVFHGEDMYMGLLLHRLRKNYKIAVSAEAVVPTYAPESFLMLFKQRTKSWDMTTQRKVWSIFKEFLLNWCTGGRSLALKPFLLYEVFAVIIDYLRTFLIVGLIFRNPFALVLLLAFFYTLQYVELMLFNFVVLANRPDLRIGFVAILLFPFYKTISMTFRVYAVLVNAIAYSTWTKKATTIHERDRHGGDLPPLPPTHTPDWFTIWQETSSTSQPSATPSSRVHAVPTPGMQASPSSPDSGSGVGAGAGAGGGAGAGAFIAAPISSLQAPQPARQATAFSALVAEIINDVGTKEKGDRGRVVAVAEAYVLFKKLSDEARAVRFVSVLQSRGQGSAATTWSVQMDDTLVAMENMLQSVVGSGFRTFNARVEGIVDRYNAAGSHLIVSEALFQRLQASASSPVSPDPVVDLVNGNFRVMSQVQSLVVGSGYPAHQNRLERVTQAVRNVLQTLTDVRAVIGA